MTSFRFDTLLVREDMNNSLSTELVREEFTVFRVWAEGQELQVRTVLLRTVNETWYCANKNKVKKVFFTEIR